MQIIPKTTHNLFTTASKPTKRPQVAQVSQVSQTLLLYVLGQVN